jgi:hypothetical protein
MPELRECLYKGSKYRFHGFFQRSYSHEGSLMVGGFPPGQEAFPVAVIESKDGSVNWVDASHITFADAESEGTK